MSEDNDRLSYLYRGTYLDVTLMPQALRYVKHKYGVEPKFDLPKPDKDNDSWGQFKTKDSSIHLAKSSPPGTLFHEVGHLKYELKIRKFRRLLNLMLCLKITVDILLFLTIYTVPIWYSLGITYPLLVGYVLGFYRIRRKHENFAHKFAVEEFNRFKKRMER